MGNTLLSIPILLDPKPVASQKVDYLTAVHPGTIYLTLPPVLRIFKPLLAAVLLFWVSPAIAQKLYAEKKVYIQKVQEPSDITAGENDHFYVVSDHGKLAEIDASGHCLRFAKAEGGDYEGICQWAGRLYISEESFRQIRVYDPTSFELLKSVPVQYSGGRNEGAEAITYNEHKQCFLLITEKNPSLILETDTNFNVLAQFASPVPEVSATTWHNGKLYLLSDEAHCVVEVEPVNYQVIREWLVPVINPEGLCFTQAGDLIIVSDDLSAYYQFKAPQP